MASVPGTKLGKYEVVKLLASGGMTELLLARTAPTERPVVLKWVRPEHAIDGAFLGELVAAAQRAAQLRHPNIVEVHEVGRDDGARYLAMEYVHGDDVRKLLARLHERRAKLPVQHILAISTSLAQALHHAHEQVDGGGAPVLHLGVRPANVIIAADGAVKLADFGLTCAALTEGRTDLLAAIAGYLSPEQCTGQPVDRRSDVFGLGILMYELATGRRLFKGENEFTTMATIVAGDIPPPSKHRGDLPKELEAVILKALARAPEDRFQTAQELQTALDKFATKAGVRGSLTTLAGYTKRLFGVRPEPWLVDDTPEPTSADFDPSPRGLATPPVECAQGLGLPSFVVASETSPLARIRKQVSRDLPTEQLNLAALRAATPDRSTPVKIPSATNGARIAPKPPVRPTPVPIAARGKPKTVQIPVPTGSKSAGQDEVTKPSALAAVPIDAMTPTRPIDPNVKSTVGLREEDTVPAALPLAPPPPSPAKPNGLNGKPAVVSVTGIEEAERRKQAAREAAELARLPSPSIAGEIPARPPSQDRTDTEVDPIKVESTAVANPPPMPATATVKDATEHVVPLPAPGDNITTTDNIVVRARNKKLFVIAASAALAVAAIGIAAFGFAGGGSDDAPPDDPPAAQTVVQDPPAAAPEEPAPAEGTEQLRTSDVPRTPRNSHVTTDDQPTPEETPAEEPTPQEPEPVPQTDVAAVPPPEPAASPVPDIEEPPPPALEEPKDPSPPDEPVAKPTRSKKSRPKAAAQQAKPKPRPVASKPKPTAKPKPKPASKWDPNALFPTKK